MSQQMTSAERAVLHALKHVHMGMDGEFVGVTERMRRSDVDSVLGTILELRAQLAASQEQVRMLREQFEGLERNVLLWLLDDIERERVVVALKDCQQAWDEYARAALATSEEKP